MTQCPCGSTKSFEECCGVFIRGEQKPATPEQLMRSRYTAYAKGEMHYILSTMQGPAAQGFDPGSALKWAQSIDWKKLEIIKSAMDKNRGQVEFIATYEDQGKEKKMHEKSQFFLDEASGQWYYVDGENISHTPYVAETRPGRNDPCSCGSGKKYKKCCMT